MELEARIGRKERVKQPLHTDEEKLELANRKLKFKKHKFQRRIQPTTAEKKIRSIAGRAYKYKT